MGEKRILKEEKEVEDKEDKEEQEKEEVETSAPPAADIDLDWEGPTLLIEP